MPGNLNKWTGADIASSSDSVKFIRKGGWFVTRTVATIAGIIFCLILIAAVLLTRYFTILHEQNEAEKFSPDNAAVSSSATFRPISYELLFNHGSSKITFDGTMLFEFNILHDIKKMNLHFDGYNVSSPQLDCLIGENNTNMEIILFDFSKENSTLTIGTSEILSKGVNCTLKMSFSGNINLEEKGVFKIPYTTLINGTSENKWVIGANLAPHYCSLVFPCSYDDSVRVRFRVKLIRPENYSSVSNKFSKAVRVVPNNSRLLLDDYEWTQEIPISSMSYYLLPEDYSARTVEGVQPGVSVWYPTRLENTTAPLIRIISALLPFYNDLFLQSLQIERLSLVAIDGLISDLPSVSGLIPLSSDLLYSASHETLRREEKLYYFLGRKLSNLWIGNLVSFTSWSDRWIVEGLALYTADLAASRSFSEYDVSTFQMSVQEKALTEELLKNPEADYFLRDMAQNNFTSYKGAYLFNMISEAVDVSLMKRALQSFIVKWMYNSTDSESLWQSFNFVQNTFDVSHFVQTWNKSSYPIVTVLNTDGNVTITQVSNGTRLWWLPLTYSSGEFMDHTKIWMKEEKTIRFQINSNDSVVLVNHLSGLFRTNYSSDLWVEIADELSTKSSSDIPNPVKSELIDDSFQLSSLNLLSYDVPFNLSRYLSKEILLAPWLVAMKHLNFISLFLEETEDFKLFQNYLEYLINGSTSNIGNLSFDIRHPRDKYLTTELNHWSCQYNLSSGCKLVDSFNTWWQQSDHLTVTLEKGDYENLKYALCYGLRYNEMNLTLSDLIALANNNTAEPYEEHNIWQSLTCTKNKETLERLLDLSLNLSDTTFSPLRTIKIWSSLEEIPENSRTAFSYVKENWVPIYESFKNQRAILSAVLKGSTYALIEEKDLEELKKMEADVSNDDFILRIFKNIEEKVEFNIRWKKDSFDSVRNWLSVERNSTKSAVERKI